jgi:hypothetical protein
LILGLIAGAGAGVLLYVGATAIEMGGIATGVGMLAAAIATVLLVASGVEQLLAIMRRRSRP